MTQAYSAAPFKAYDRACLKIRVFHIGFGAFAKAHTAVFHDEMLCQTGGDWGMAVARLNFGAEDLSALDFAGGLFTVGEMSDDDLALRRVGAVVKTLHPKRDGVAALISQIANPDLQVITLTITEKGYCLANGELDLGNPGITSDLEAPGSPVTAIGLLSEGLRKRKAAGLSGITILSCDNLPANGSLCRTAVLGFAEKRDAALSSWIAAQCCFPCSMVDRITPAMTEDSHAKLQTSLGAADPNGILCEPFRQWVIEDDFAGEKPRWDLGGATFVSDVEPYEDLKLRLLNGSHSFLAYLGALAGKQTISDCMEDPVFKQAAHKLMIEEQAKTLTVPGGFDIAAYADTLIVRYSNRALHHKTTQITSDGSQKLPQRLLNPIRVHLDAGSDWTLSALAVAGWLKYCRGVAEDGSKLPLNDPYAERIAGLATDHSGEAYVMKMLVLGDVFGADLPTNPAFVSKLVNAYQTLEAKGSAATLSASL